jgi:magnesium transporter
MASRKTKKRLLANDATESIGMLLRIRLPWLLLGLVLSLGTAFVVSRYEEILAADTRLVFFIPLIVYVSDAVGTQTATIYIRNLSKKQATFRAYVLKELFVGFFIGMVFGLATGVTTQLWLQSPDIAITVGLAMWTSITTATVFSLSMAAFLNSLNIDPASGADPLVTVGQDVISLLIYFAIATAIIF